MACLICLGCYIKLEQCQELKLTHSYEVCCCIIPNAGAQVKLFLDNNTQPSLIVNDLKHGAELSGAIGLWVDVGAEGFFSDLKIQKSD